MRGARLRWALDAVAAAGHDDITRAQGKLLQRINDSGSRLREITDPYMER
jgi:hypothetical protein